MKTKLATNYKSYEEDVKITFDAPFPEASKWGEMEKGGRPGDAGTLINVEEDKVFNELCLLSLSL